MDGSPIVIYQNNQGGVQLDVRLEDETVWLSQAQIAQLFGKGRSTISEHISSIFKEGEVGQRWCVGISGMPANLMQ